MESQVGFAIVLHDITAVAELQRAEDELIGMVSHELRTPRISIVDSPSSLSIDHYPSRNRSRTSETC
jgi:signal transduction histidine kinase